MRIFHLQIVTPDGLIFDSGTQKILVRTTEGDVGILGGHADYAAPLDTGIARVTVENGDTKTAACSGGLLSVKDGIVRIVADTFEWADDIDIERARKARERAEKKLKNASEHEEKIAEIKLRRAIARIRASEGH